jgi:hypothetical protein
MLINQLVYRCHQIFDILNGSDKNEIFRAADPTHSVSLRSTSLRSAAGTAEGDSG